MHGNDFAAHTQTSEFHFLSGVLNLIYLFVSEPSNKLTHFLHFPFSLSRSPPRSLSLSRRTRTKIIKAFSYSKSNILSSWLPSSFLSFKTPHRNVWRSTWMKSEYAVYEHSGIGGTLEQRFRTSARIAMRNRRWTNDSERANPCQGLKWIEQERKL